MVVESEYFEYFRTIGLDLDKKEFNHQRRNKNVNQFKKEKKHDRTKIVFTL